MVGLDSGEDVKTTLGVVTDLRLFVGKELDERALDELRLLSLRSIAREKALEILSRRPMSRAEVRKKLLEKGIDGDAADNCVAWLVDHSLIDEEVYAASVARHYAAKGCGAGRIKTELNKRGISREMWDKAVFSAPDNSDKIHKFIASRLTDPSDRAQVGKVSQALYRRGLTWEEIRSALERFEE